MTRDIPDSQIIVEPPDPPMHASYIRVVVIEIIVLLALWTFSRAFSG